MDVPALISRKAFAGTCRHCMEALEIFVSAYGAECGNLALRAVTTRGLYIGGGIAPKILPALQTGHFLDSFCAKSPMKDLLATIPVKVILNPQAGLLGAASVRERTGPEVEASTGHAGSQSRRVPHNACSPETPRAPMAG